MKAFYKLGIAGLILLFMLSLGAAPALHAQGSRKQVLLINSYHRGYKWSDDIERGIESALGVGKEDVDLRVEYMDTKRFSDDAYLLKLYELWKFKYSRVPFDVILTSDDAAITFLLEYGDSLFPGVPVVFSGANFFDESRLVGHTNVTGVSEELDIRGTLAIALKLYPNTKRIVVVNDETVTGQRVHVKLVQTMPEYKGIQFTFLEAVTMDQVREQVRQLPADSLVFLTVFFRDKAGAFFEYDSFTSLVAESSSVPVFAGWDFSLGYGAVGGKLTSGYTEGTRAGAIAKRILQGEKPWTIPIVRQIQSQYMFDYNQLQRFGINMSSLPPESVIINRPFSFYETYKTLVWVVIGSFIILATIAVILFANVLARRRAEQELSDTNRELEENRLLLERRVEARTSELAQRAIQLQAASEVARATTSVLDLQVLLRQVVDLARERFGLYYVGLFLIDRDRRSAVLSAGTGEAGEQMLAQHHQLPIGSSSMIGQCVARDEARIAQDTGEEAVRFNNPLLPHTRSELALPLHSRGQVIGALTAQSEHAEAFDPATIAVMQTMADQVAVAIDNARLFSEAQAALQEMQTTQTRYQARAWSEYLRRRTTSGYEQVGPTLVPLAGETLPEVRQAADRQQVIAGDGQREPDAASTLVAPIVLRGQPIGALGCKNGSAGHEWTPDEIALAEVIGQEFALAVENLRLFEEAQRLAAREQMINTVTARIRGTPTVSAILQRTVEELGQMFGTSRARIQLEVSEPENTPRTD